MQFYILKTLQGFKVFCLTYSKETGGFVGGPRSSHAGRPKQEENQRQHHPAHNNHG